MPTVYFVQCPNANTVDIEQAKAFGEVKHIFPPFSQPALDTKSALETLRNGLRSFKEGDFLAFAGGDPGGLLMAGMVLPEITADIPIKWLRWERGKSGREGHYVEIVIDLED